MNSPLRTFAALFVVLVSRPAFGQAPVVVESRPAADASLEFSTTESAPNEPTATGCLCSEETEGGIDAIFGDKPALHFLRNRDLGIGGWTYSVGGQLRYRVMDERFRLRPQGNVRRDTYNLWRFTPFAEIGNDRITAHVQAIDASIFGEDIPMLPIDENRADLLQYYVDLNIGDVGGNPLHVRYGRQFLKYGSQLLVSPLPWANTFRNFEGTRLYYQGETWDVDGFAVQPLNAAANNTSHPQSFDTLDQSVWFAGAYARYKKLRRGQFDVYWLWLNEDEPKLNRQDGRRHTIGGRYHGTMPVADSSETVRYTWLWDVEGAWQFGRDGFQNGGGNLDVNAGFVTAISSITFNRVPWQPTLKGLFWWGSGDDDPGDGRSNTLTTLFPFGHYYWGLIDNFNGANLLDYSVQVSVKPTKKLTYLAAWHWFDKANRNDHVYNVAGAPLGPLGGARNIGQELDLLATYAVNPNLSFQMGYFWFWYGGAVDGTALARPDAHQFYFMATWGF
ncbi:MAG: alginate export family protein [Planctomycetaceae bacterium]